jgi:hypothetical protein
MRLKMKNVILLSFFFLFQTVLLPKTIIVDLNGGGQFTKIQDAITNATASDTIKVWPGSYNEQITLNKNIILIGSGYENTAIVGNFNPTITMSTGKLQWFKLSSTGGNGMNLSGGLVTNCVITGCSNYGIYNGTSGSYATVTNCVVFGNVYDGISASSGGIINVTNTISRNNGSNGFDNHYSSATINLSYSDGSRGYTSGNQGCIDQDPNFTSVTNLDFHLSEGSPCWNTGNPAYTDPDGSIGDMGYFGGPDCPIYPTVYEITISPNGATIDLHAKARANY